LGARQRRRAEVRHGLTSRPALAAGSPMRKVKRLPEASAMSQADMPRRTRTAAWVAAGGGVDAGGETLGAVAGAASAGAQCRRAADGAGATVVGAGRLPVTHPATCWPARRLPFAVRPWSTVTSTPRLPWWSGGQYAGPP
jgi:hypothetical protein